MRKNDNRDCNRAAELTNQALEQDPMTLPDQAFLKQHLQVCAQCQQYDETLRQLVETIRTLPEQAVPVGLEDKILSAVTSGEARKTSTQKGLYPWRYAAVAAAVVVLVMVVSALLPSMPLGQQSSDQQKIAHGTSVGQSIVSETALQYQPDGSAQWVAQSEPVAVGPVPPREGTLEEEETMNQTSAEEQLLAAVYPVQEDFPFYESAYAEDDPIIVMVGF